MSIWYLHPGPSEQGIVYVTKQSLIGAAQLSANKVNVIGILSLHCYFFLFFVIVLVMNYSDYTGYPFPTAPPVDPFAKIRVDDCGKTKGCFRSV